jgi:hypothetical protein
MADASHPFDARRRRPRDWGDAFAELPLETPPLSVWSQITARLETDTASAMPPPTADAASASSSTDTTQVSALTATPKRMSTRAWLALAASLSALALLPLLWPGKDTPSHTPNITAQPIEKRPSVAASITKAEHERPASQALDLTVHTLATTNSADQNSAPIAAPLPKASPQPSPPTTTATDRIAIDAVSERADAPTPVGAISPLPVPREDIAAEGDTADEARTAAVNIAAPGGQSIPSNAVVVGEADADATAREMEMLYTASAQLETLLTYARDPRVETGPVAALSSEIHTRLAKIDARLAQPGLSAHEQYALWQARVGTLRQAVEVESTLRALSTEGEGAEGQVVDIY